MSEVYVCPNCHEKAMKGFFQLQAIPVNSCILMESQEEAVSFPKGELDLAFCNHCGFISNMKFDEKMTEYSGRYEETQGYSGVFNKFHQQLAKRLVNKYNLRNKDVVEIGCGKGEFLVLLCELGENRGVGFDPGYQEGRLDSPAMQNIRFVQDFYSEKYSDVGGDFFCCKMTLEHIHPTLDFVRMVRNAIGDRENVIVFFQVPEVTRILKETAFEDIYYEHCSYFSPGSIARLFQSCGFKVLDIDTEYDGQYLTIETKPVKEGSTDLGMKVDDLDELRELVKDFTVRCRAKIDEWEQRLKEAAAGGEKVVLWGSGSKGVSFLTTIGGSEVVEYVVDINPHRHDYYMPGTGQKIVGPEFLKEYKPDTVVVMNRIYLDEIKSMIEQYGLNPQYYAL